MSKWDVREFMDHYDLVDERYQAVASQRIIQRQSISGIEMATIAVPGSSCCLGVFPCGQQYGAVLASPEIDGPATTIHLEHISQWTNHGFAYLGIHSRDNDGRLRYQMAMTPQPDTMLIYYNDYRLHPPQKSRLILPLLEWALLINDLLLIPRTLFPTRSPLIDISARVDSLMNVFCTRRSMYYSPLMSAAQTRPLASALWQPRQTSH